MLVFLGFASGIKHISCNSFYVLSKYSGRFRNTCHSLTRQCVVILQGRMLLLFLYALTTVACPYLVLWLTMYLNIILMSTCNEICKTYNENISITHRH